MKSFIIIIISLFFYSVLFSQPSSRSSCGNYAWGVWADQGSTDTATAILTSNGQTVNMLMTANYNFSFTPSIFYFNYFNGFPDNPPNSTVPLTTWAAGPGGTTKMCFSTPIQNPVLLLASIGNSSNSVSLSFSVPYTVLFNGGGNTYVNPTSLIGTEGYCILEFPGTHSCVTVFSSTPEWYTNLTWGIKVPPIVNFTYSQNCLNNSVNFFGSLVNITNPLTISNWLWNFGDGDTSHLQNPTHSYTNYGNYNVQLIVTTTNNCTDTTTQTISIINPIAAFLGNDTSICQGTNFQLNAFYTGCTYLWNTGATTQTINVTSSGTYSVKVTNSSGCVGKDTIVVNTVPKPNVNLSNDTTICKGQSVVLSSIVGSQNICMKSQLPLNLQQGLYALYPFCGNANDESGNANNGIVNGATLTTDRFGNANRAYFFDGINDYINRSSLPDMTSLTISAWVFHINGHNHSNILCDMNSAWGNDLYMSMSDSTIGIIADKSGAQLALASGWGGASPPPQALTNQSLENQWKHIVWVMYPTYSTIYINGVLAGTYNYTGSNVGYHNVTNIGRLNDGVYDGNYFKGKIDDIFIYNRTISASEVQQLYNTGTSTSLAYHWSTGDTTQSITVTPSQTTTYYLTVTNGSCSGVDSVKVSVSPLPIVNLGNDTTICQGNQILLNAGNSGCTYLWSTGVTTQTINVTSSGTYWVKVTNSNGCIGKDTISVNVIANIIVNLGNDTTICQGNSLTLNAGNIGASYLWSTGVTTQQINVTNSGTYWVKVTNSNGCYKRDTIVVNIVPIPVINLSNDTAICKGQSVVLSGTGSTQNICSKSQLPLNLQQGLYALYPFCGNANDESGNSNNGIVNGSTLTTDRFGNTNSAYSFDGINNYISRAPLQDMTSLTISAWVYHTNGHYHSNILCDMNSAWGNDFHMSMTDSTVGIRADKNGAQLALATNWSGTNPPQALNNIYLENMWKHIAWVMHPAYSEIYINGVIAGTFNYTGSNVGYHNTSYFGRLYDNNYDGNFFKGKIDDIFIYNRTLSASEVQQLYTIGGASLSNHWSTGDTIQSITVTPSQTTNYYLTVTNGSCSGVDSVKVSVSPLPLVNLGNDTTICQGNQILLNAGNIGCTYLWNTGATTQALNVTSSGTYWVKVTNSNGCIGKDTISVNIVSNFIVNLGNDTTICQGNPLTLNAGNVGAYYLWSTGATTQQINVINLGTYWVKVTNSNGCFAKDTIIVSFITNLIVNLGNDTSICQGDELLLEAGNTGSNYQWNTGANTQTISIQNSGTYWVQVDNNNC
ncbi:MAG: LamG-like jellyroll fold domain-containing protein, partial [Bacteroidales bacterium]